MRTRAVLVAAAVAAGPSLAVLPSAAAEAPPAGETPDTDPLTAEARRHFREGVRLYRAGHYLAALAEFEAAHQSKPGPGSLQNVALCQKALGRFADAADTLKKLLHEYGPELSDEERTAAQKAHDELEAAIGSIVLVVRPSHAKVTLDGRPLDAAALGAPLRLNAGTHAVVADAPGFRRAVRTVELLRGARDVRIDIALEAVLGFLEIRATDPSAVIALDGRPLGLGSWTGPVAPDEEHLVQIYRSGFEPFEARVSVERGETRSVIGTLGERTDEPEAPPAAEGALPEPPPARPVLGWYSIVGLNLLGTSATPLDVDATADSASSGALSVNLRVGRRLWTTLGAEVLLDLGQLGVDGACDKSLTAVRGGDCDGRDRVERDYTLGWLRAGPLVRLSTPGARLRAGAGFGFGLVWHELRLERVERAPADPDVLEPDGGRARGVDPFVLLEIGAAYHFDHFSLGLDLTAQLDGARNLQGSFDGANRRAFATTGSTVPMLGIGLRAGYSQWPAPKRTP